MAFEPVPEPLRVAGFRVGVVRCPQHCHKDLCLTDLARAWTDDGQRRAAVVDKALLAGLVQLAHRALLALAPLAVALAVLRVAVAAVRILAGVLLPQQLFGHLFALELLMDAGPVRDLVAL